MKHPRVKVAVISPIAHLQEFDEYCDIHMILLPFLSDERYLEFYRSSTKYKIIDNGVFETGKSASFDELMEKAKEIEASEVILPDVRDKSKETLKLAKQCVSVLSKSDRKRFKFMVVCQAKTSNQLIRRYSDYAALPVDVLGLCRPLRRHPIDRVVAVRWLQIAHRFDLSKEHHFLGLDDPVELKLVRRIRSVDTTWPIRYGYVGKYQHLAKSMPKWLLPHMDFEEVLEPHVIERAKFNCKVLREYAW